MSVRAFLERAFDGDFTEEDWQHCLGGRQVLVVEDGEVVAHGAVVPRTLWHGERELRCGYVEGVAVREDRRGRGLGAAVMAAVEEVVRHEYELGALSSTDSGLGFYEGRGWERWRGRLLAGGERTPDDEGGVFVLPVGVSLDLDGDLACEPRPGCDW